MIAVGFSSYLSQYYVSCNCNLFVHDTKTIGPLHWELLTLELEVAVELSSRVVGRLITVWEVGLQFAFSLRAVQSCGPSLSAVIVVELFFPGGIFVVA